MTLDKEQCYQWTDGKIVFGDFLKPAEGSKIREAGAGTYLNEADEPDIPDTPWITVPEPEISQEDLDKLDDRQKEEARRQITEQTAEIEKAINEAVNSQEFVKQGTEGLKEVLEEQQLPNSVELKQTLDNMELETVITVAEDGTVTATVLIKKLVYEIGLYDTESGEKVELSGNSRTIRFPVVLPSQGIGAEAKYVKTTHKGSVTYSSISEDGGTKYTVIETKSFSQFVLEFTDSKPANRPDSSRGGSSSSGSSRTSSARWVQDNTGWWYRNSDGTWPADCWSQLMWNGSSQWYRFNGQGYMVTGWYLDADGNWYFLHNVPDGTQGHMYTGWHQINGKWYYFRENAGGPMGSLVMNAATPDGYQADGEGVCADYTGN